MSSQPIELRDWCNACKQEVPVKMTVDPDVTEWRCMHCGTLTDSMFTDDEIEWEGECDDDD